MTDFKFDFEWLDPGPTGPAELEATRALFAMFADDVCLTRFYRSRSESVRSRLVLPLYPLAEWFASNWWHLFYGTYRPGRSTNTSYDRRHCIRYAREGYALPDVCIRPTGDAVLIQWAEASLDHYGVQFITEASARPVARAEFEREATRLVEAVLGRLEQHDVVGTFLQDEWTAICSLETEEEEFCKAAARLGLDPFNVSDNHKHLIEEAAEVLPKDLHDSFFAAAAAGDLQKQARAASSALRLFENEPLQAHRLVSLRHDLPSYTPQPLPWDEGYSYARMLRRALDCETRTFATTAELLNAFSDPGDTLEDALKPFESQGLFDAFVAVQADETPGFAVDEGRDESKRFALCRGVFEYFNAKNGTPLLVTREHTERQQRNRSFAAEFLAPATLLRAAVSGPIVDADEVEELAETFGVSSYVVRHQLENHDVVEEIVA